MFNKLQKFFSKALSLEQQEPRCCSFKENQIITSVINLKTDSSCAKPTSEPVIKKLKRTLNR